MLLHYYIHGHFMQSSWEEVRRPNRSLQREEGGMQLKCGLLSSGQAIRGAGWWHHAVLWHGDGTSGTEVGGLGEPGGSDPRENRLHWLHCSQDSLLAISKISFIFFPK